MCLAGCSAHSTSSDSQSSDAVSMATHALWCWHYSHGCGLQSRWCPCSRSSTSPTCTGNWRTWWSVVFILNLSIIKYLMEQVFVRNRMTLDRIQIHCLTLQNDMIQSSNPYCCWKTVTCHVPSEHVMFQVTLPCMSKYVFMRQYAIRPNYIFHLS